MKNIKENSKISRLSDKGYYPIFIDIKGRPCLVFGGGAVAERKIKLLMKFGAEIKVISPKVTKKISLLEAAGKISVLKRGYSKGDLANAALVFAATSSRETNNRIKNEGERAGILVNVVDDPELCDFIVPSIIKKGPVVIAISTSGTLPMFSKKLRKEIEEIITDDYIRYVRLIGRFRKILIEQVKDSSSRRRIMDKLGRLEVKEVLDLGMDNIKKQFIKTYYE